jgi:hypothetical protein
LSFASSFVESGSRDDPIVLHLGARIDIANGNYRLAQIKLMQVLTNDKEVSRPLLCAVFGDLEECCKYLNDFRGAYEYSNTKIDLFQRMLTDD